MPPAAASAMDATATPRVAVPRSAPTVPHVNTNEHATATSGATNDVTPKDADDSIAEAGKEDFRTVNAELRYEFLRFNVLIQQAKAAGDERAEAAARRGRARVAETFVTKNVRLAQQAATPLMIRDRDTSSEHFQAALLGLWKAFVGTDPTTIDGVVVGDDGTLHPTGGWDPAKGTFSTWAGTSISGEARRSVRAAEGAFTGISYNTWGQRPKVEAATAKLVEELGREPSIAEIAARANVTQDTVRALTFKGPRSLDAQVSGDGDATLADLISNVSDDDDGGARDHDEETQALFVEAASNMGAIDLMVFLLRSGLLGQAPRSVVQTADLLGIGRGSVAPALARAEAQLAEVS